MPATTTVMGPVGPEIWDGVPPNRAAIKPTAMAPYMPAAAPFSRPTATPKPSARGSATMPAVIPPKMSPRTLLKKRFFKSMVSSGCSNVLPLATRFQASNPDKINRDDDEIETRHDRQSLGADGVQDKLIQCVAEAGCYETSSGSCETQSRCFSHHSAQGYQADYCRRIR